MKKIGFLMIIFIIIGMFGFSDEVCANDGIEVGTYVQLGKYNDEPIVWKCIDIDDENGILMLSDKILSYKSYDIGDEGSGFEYGDGFWEDSTIRAWLNSSESSGNIKWPEAKNPGAKFINGPYLPYDTEDGFISEQNFSAGELEVMKTTSQWQILTYSRLDMATNGVSHIFQRHEKYYGDGRSEGRSAIYADIDDLSHVEGAMYRVNDTLFLLDVRQAYRLWYNFGTVEATPTQAAFNTVAEYDDYVKFNNFSYCCLRTPTGYNITYMYGEKEYDCFLAGYAYGIRPAFYLNESNYQILSGSGTEMSPYVVSSKFTQTSTAVFSQGRQLAFENEPIINEDGILLVPFETVCESLGSTFEVDEGDGVITAVNDECTIVMQLSNTEMGNGTDVISLDLSPQYVNGEVMVTLETIEKSFDCSVEYISELNRVVIDKPDLPMDFGDGVGIEDWQQDWYKKMYDE